MYYGIDVGGTKIELAIFNAQLDIVCSWRESTPVESYDDFLTLIESMVAKADALSGVKGTVGIGFPGIIDSTNCAVSANVSCMNGRTVVEDTLKRLGRKVAFENDVKAFVFSEVNKGTLYGSQHQKNRQNILGIVLGTGIAGGLCINGEMYVSRQGVSCEFGHIPLPAILQQRYNFPLRKCGCGLESCMEQYLAGPGLEWMCSHFDAPYHSVHALIDGLHKGEKAAHRTFDNYIDCLGCYFANLTMMYDPDLVVLGGGLSNIDEIYTRLPSAIKQYLLNGVKAPPVIGPQFGDSSGVRGAAIIGFNAAEAQL